MIKRCMCIMDVHFSPWVWEIFVYIGYICIIHIGKLNNTLLAYNGDFFLAGFNCSAPQCFVLIGSIYVTIFRGGLVGGRQPASQAARQGDLRKFLESPTLHITERLYTLKKHHTVEKDWSIIHFETLQTSLQFTGHYWTIDWVLHADIWNTTFCNIVEIYWL